MQGEDLVVLIVETLQDIRHEIELVVEHDETRVGIDRHHAQVALVSHEHPPGPAGLPRLASHRLEVDDTRHPGQAVRHGWQLAGRDIGFEERRLDGRHRGGWCRGGRCRGGRHCGGWCRGGRHRGGRRVRWNGRRGVVGAHLPDGQRGQETEEREDPGHAINSLLSTVGRARTKWPSPRSSGTRLAGSPSSRKRGAQCSGSDALPWAMRLRSRGRSRSG